MTLSRRLVGSDILSKVANNVTARVVLAGKELGAVAVNSGTANGSSVLPDQLGEMASGLGELAGSVVVLRVLVVPGLDGSVGVGVAHGNVLTVGAARVGKDTVLVVEVVLGKAGKGLVPGNGLCAVLAAVVVGGGNTVVSKAVAGRGRASRAGGRGRGAGGLRAGGSLGRGAAGSRSRRGGSSQGGRGRGSLGSSVDRNSHDH